MKKEKEKEERRWVECLKDFTGAVSGGVYKKGEVYEVVEVKNKGESGYGIMKDGRKVSVKVDGEEFSFIGDPYCEYLERVLGG